MAFYANSSEQNCQFENLAAQKNSDLKALTEGRADAFVQDLSRLETEGFDQVQI